jgi:hypothetical protein
MRKRRLILAVLLGGLVFQSAFADSDRDEGRGRGELQREHRRMTPSEAAMQAQRNHGGGRVLAVEAADNGYRVKLLQRGDVHIVFVPAE